MGGFMPPQLKGRCEAEESSTLDAQREQMGPVDVNGSVHTTLEQLQRLCVLCARTSCVDWASYWNAGTTHWLQRPKCFAAMLMRGWGRWHASGRWHISGGTQATSKDLRSNLRAHVQCGLGLRARRETLFQLALKGLAKKQTGSLM